MTAARALGRPEVFVDPMYRVFVCVLQMQVDYQTEGIWYSCNLLPSRVGYKQEPGVVSFCTVYVHVCCTTLLLKGC